MPLHDWTRVDAGIFHDFHNAWVVELRTALNGGLLPPDYYALVEQHAGRRVADLLTLQTRAPEKEPPPGPAQDGGLALAEAPPKVRVKLSSAGSLRRLRRTVAIRHVSGHRLIALVEIVSPANKDREEHVKEFAAKAITALENGVHVLLADTFAPGRHDPRGMHAAIWEHFADDVYEPPAGEPFTLAAYAAGPAPDAYVEHLALGGAMPDMPLLLSAERYVNVPLEATYQAAYRGFPAYWRAVLEGKPA